MSMAARRRVLANLGPLPRRKFAPAWRCWDRASKNSEGIIAHRHWLPTVHDPGERQPIFVSPMGDFAASQRARDRARNGPCEDDLDSARIAASIKSVLKRGSNCRGKKPVALIRCRGRGGKHSRGSMPFAMRRCGLEPCCARSSRVLVGDGDVGGLIGIHIRRR